MRRYCTFILIVLALGPVASTALAQGFPFQLRAQQGSNVSALSNGATLNFSADAIGQPSAIQITATYQGRTSVAVTDPPQLLGSSDFGFTSIGQLPLILKPNDSFSFEVRFRPSSRAQVSAQFTIRYFEAVDSISSPVPSPSNPTPIPGAIIFTLSGIAPDLAVSYFLQSDGNVIPLFSGSTLAFSPTVLNTSSLATVIVSNRGSGPGTINSISLAGAAFQLIGLPLLPGSVSPATDLRFVIRYSPRQIGNDTGSLQLVFTDRTVNVVLQGSGTGSTFSYELLQDSGNVTFLPNQVVPLADTRLGEKSSVTVRVRNTGNADGQVGAIGTSGDAFSVTDLPILPSTLAPNSIVTFTLNFAPVQPGKATGKLRIGNDLFDLAGTGIGVKLVYSYSNGTTTTPVLPAGPVIFSPVQVGQSSHMDFSVHNTGTTTAAIASIGVVDTHGSFRLENLPPLPASLDPDASVTFSIVFSPGTIGFTTTALQIDALSFALSGSGTPPPDLPDYRFTGSSGQVEPLQQPAIGLALASPYPLTIRGGLTLTINSDAFTADPSVQFATGGRTVAFTIPANSLQAVFQSGNTEIRLQTGTTTSNITLTPSFAIPSGLDVTPDSPKTLVLTVSPGPPQLLSVRVASKTVNSFALEITGFATTRSLRKLDFQFQTTPDAKLSATQFSIDLAAAAAAWYSSTTAQPFGGQFDIVLPFTLTGVPTTLPSPVDVMQSVSVTATNDQGVSSPQSVALR